MPIPLSPPVPHPYQPGVALDSLAVDSLSLSSGAAIDGPARLSVLLRPYAAVKTAGGGVAYLSPPAVQGGAGMIPLEIPDVYAWVAKRAAAGDLKPFQAMTALVEALGEEYSRRPAAN